MNGWKIASLFSGIGGLELGLERAGLGEVVAQVEFDPYASAILEAHWPDAKRFGDIREVRGSDLGRVEVMCGGFPCQDISNANQDAQGIDGERSGLWAEYARIIGEVRPRIVVVENVAALLRRGIDRVLGDLAALGYDAEWGCISAASVGAHHLRERIFIVAYPNGFGQLDRGPGIFSAETREQALAFLGCGGTTLAHANGEWQLQPKGGQPDKRGRFSNGGQETTMADALRSGPQGAGPGWPVAQCAAGRSRPGRWEPEPLVGRVANGIPDRVDRLRCLGNAVVPQVAEYLGGLIVSALQTCAAKGPDSDRGADEQ